MLSRMTVEGKYFIQEPERVSTQADAHRPDFGWMPAGAKLP